MDEQDFQNFDHRSIMFVFFSECRPRESFNYEIEKEVYINSRIPYPPPPLIPPQSRRLNC